MSKKLETVADQFELTLTLKKGLEMTEKRKHDMNVARRSHNAYMSSLSSMSRERLKAFAETLPPKLKDKLFSMTQEELKELSDIFMKRKWTKTWPTCK